MAITWRQIAKVCNHRGIEIQQGKGGEVKLKGPSPDGSIHVMRIGHKCCASRNSVVYPDYVKKFQRTFGVSDDEL